MRVSIVFGSMLISTRDLLGQIARVATTDAKVLIRGESGSGKELVANALQAAGARCDAPFVKLNCASIPAQLVEDLS